MKHVKHDKLAELAARLSEVDDLQRAAEVLVWDQSTYMPSGGGEGRGRQLGTLASVAHAKLTDPAVGRLLEELRSLEEELPYDSDEASLVRVARRDHTRAVCVPNELMSDLRRHQAAAYEIWAKARPANDFGAVRPVLEKTLDLSRRLAQCLPQGEHIADPLIDELDTGMRASTVRDLFTRLRAELVPLVKAVTARPPADNSCLRQVFPEADQLAFGLSVATAIGYDLERGRQDKTHHPFMIRFSAGDVRITTRVKPDDLSEALFSTVHEAGHALYEQGVRQDLDGTPLAGGTSAGVHESQSRLWENIVGRSLPFWKHFYPSLQRTFPAQLGAVDLDTFYRAVNRVERSLIRTDADEVTYNLHVMMRFSFELELLEGKLAVKDLPEAWRARFREDLGIGPPDGDDRDGCLQDVHWFSGMVGGMFQGYTIGNVLSAQLFAAALRAHPGIPAEIEAGQFSTLRNWLTQNLYQHGRKFTAPEIIERATGSPLVIEPYVTYLRTKYLS
jgi:carboxypeptidase Taq